MGDDFFNPFTAETHIKRVSFWETAFGILLAAGLGMAAVWAVAVVLMSLERAYS